MAKVDAKNKLLLDNYKEEESRKTGGASQEDAVHEKREDDEVVDAIKSILSEYKAEIDNYESIQEEQQLAKSSKVLQSASIEDDKRDLINREIGKFRKTAEADEQKKEKEKDRKKREETRDKDKRRSASPRKDKDKKSSRRRSRSRDREREREREKERELREREREQREKEREREQRERDYREQRERDRDHRDEKILKAPRDVQKEKEMEDEMRDRKKAEKKAREKEAAYQERLRNWEMRERRRTKEYEKEKEKELNREEEREKEAKRLKEFLEDYDDERDDSKYYKGRELQRRLAERVREADLDGKDRNKEQEELEELKNKIFSGDYDNPTQEFERLKRQRDDLYKPKILIDVNLEQSQQRERELARERERDAERQKVKDRERAQKERYVLAQASREMASLNAEPIESTDSSNDASHFDNGGGNDDRYANSPRTTRYNNNDRTASNHGGSESRDAHLITNSSIHNDDDSRSSMRSIKSLNSPISAETPPIAAPVISLNLGANAKKKRLEVKDIFNNEEDNEDNNGPKKRKLVPLGNEFAPFTRIALINSFFHPFTDYEDNVNQTSHRSSNASNASVTTNASENVAPTTQPSNVNNSSSKRKDGGKADDIAKKEDSARTQEEKRRHIKSIIDKIPTGKSDLFNYKLDWSEIDNPLMEKKIRPWINKKIIEYIGEPEPTLVDFICSKVLAGSTPQGILDDVQMVSISCSCHSIRCSRRSFRFRIFLILFNSLDF